MLPRFRLFAEAMPARRKQADASAHICERQQAMRRQRATPCRALRCADSARATPATPPPAALTRHAAPYVTPLFRRLLIRVDAAKLLGHSAA